MNHLKQRQDLIEALLFVHEAHLSLAEAETELLAVRDLGEDVGSVQDARRALLAVQAATGGALDALESAASHEPS